MADTLGETLARYRGALDSPSVRQLNRDWALVTFTVLTEAFDGSRGSIHSDEFHQRIALCFDALRKHPLPEGSNVKLPDSAHEIRDRVNDWVRSELLYRYDDEDGHHYRLTAHATSAQQYLDAIHEAQRSDRSYASGQGAQHLLHLGRELALAIAPDPEAVREHLDDRRTRLRAEIAKIDAQIEEIDQGAGVEPEPIGVVLDKYQHFADAVSTMLANMKMVEQQIDRLGGAIREAFSNDTRPHGQIINQYLDWLAEAHDSAAGLGFNAAYEVLAETDLFDTLLRSSMSHELMSHLTPAQARQFRATPRQLRTAMTDVVTVQNRMDRRVRNFLQTYDPRSDRQISHLLERCHRMLADLSRTVRSTDELDLPSDDPNQPEGQWPTDKASMPILSIELDMTPPSTPMRVKVAGVPASTPDPDVLARMFALGAPHDTAIRGAIDDVARGAAAPVTGFDVFNHLSHDDSRIADLAGLIRIAAETDGAIIDTTTTATYLTRRHEGPAVEYEAPTITFSLTTDEEDHSDA